MNTIKWIELVTVVFPLITAVCDLALFYMRG